MALQKYGSGTHAELFVNPASLDAQFARLRCGRRAIAYIELPKDLMQMTLCGSYANRQLLSDLLVAEPATATPQHFGFPWSQHCILGHQRYSSFH